MTRRAKRERALAHRPCCGMPVSRAARNECCVAAPHHPACEVLRARRVAEREAADRRARAAEAAAPEAVSGPHSPAPPTAGP